MSIEHRFMWLFWIITWTICYCLRKRLSNHYMVWLLINSNDDWKLFHTTCCVMCKNYCNQVNRSNLYPRDIILFLISCTFVVWIFNNKAGPWFLTHMISTQHFLKKINPGETFPQHFLKKNQPPGWNFFSNCEAFCTFLHFEFFAKMPGGAW